MTARGRAAAARAAAALGAVVSVAAVTAVAVMAAGVGVQLLRPVPHLVLRVDSGEDAVGVGMGEV